jgi:hypothetical protein
VAIRPPLSLEVHTSGLSVSDHRVQAEDPASVRVSYFQCGAPPESWRRHLTLALLPNLGGSCP